MDVEVRFNASHGKQDEPENFEGPLLPMPVWVA